MGVFSQIPTPARVSTRSWLERFAVEHRTSRQMRSPSLGVVMRRAWILLAALILLAGMPSQAFADDTSTLAIGPTIGLNRSILTSPNDATGEPVFMSGSAFNGFGATGGLSARYALKPFLALEADLLLSQDRATGFEERSGQRREMSISTLRLRLPITLQGTWGNDTLRFQGGLGAELALPLSSSTELTEESIPVAEGMELAVEAPLGIGATLSLGTALRVSESMWIPTTLRATWFPGVASTSSERFDGFVSPSEPGTFQIAYDWTVIWSAGVLFDVL